MKILLALSFSIGLSAVVQAQDVAPPLLIHVAQCLEAKGFLPPSKSTSSFGYFLDSTSYPQQNALYVVEFANSSRSKGWVFTVFLSNENDRQVFNIQNNARFVPSKDGYLGIDFPDSPLGGVWTQEHIVSAIKKIQRASAYQISNQTIQNARLDFQCESYTDPR